MSEPINMILPCPRCGLLHVDTPEPENGWTNPPHKSHLCHNEACVDAKGKRTIWRPAPVPTNGVAKLESLGENDTWPSDGEPTCDYQDNGVECGRSADYEVYQGKELVGIVCAECRDAFYGIGNRNDFYFKPL